MEGNYIIPKIINNTLYRLTNASGGINPMNNGTFALYYGNIPGTIIGLKLACLYTGLYFNPPLMFPGPYNITPFTTINTQSPTNYFQSPFIGFTPLNVNLTGPFNYPNIINIPIPAPSRTTDQYVEAVQGTHLLTETKSYLFEINVVGNAAQFVGVSYWYLYKNGVEYTRMIQADTSQQFNSIGCIITLNPGDTQELRLSCANAVGSSGLIRSVEYSLIEIKS